MSKSSIRKVVITGGAGYVGSFLVPSLLEEGYEVTVLDLFLYGKHVFDSLKNSPKLHLIEGDIRNTSLLKRVFKEQECLIHLACISNDPSFDLNAALGKSINFDAFPGMIQAVQESPIQRFIYASSSSVYGVNPAANIDETTACHPLTDYSLYKLKCEELLHKAHFKNCIYTIIRPATVCGYAPRLRLDLTVNILTIHALVNQKILVFGGPQLRPHIHIQDMVNVYKHLLGSPISKIASQTFNAGYENKSVLETAQLVQDCISTQKNQTIALEVKESSDLRSYHIDSTRIRQMLGFVPKYSLKDAVQSLVTAYEQQKIINPLENTLYYNIKRMKEVHLQ